jgi:hypothetical protein
VTVQANLPLNPFTPDLGSHSFPLDLNSTSAV